MANVQKVDMVNIDLNTGNIHRSFFSHAIGLKDQNGDGFGIRVFRDGEPVNLTGVSIQGVFMPPQGSPIAITSGNSVSDNEAYVVLPQLCYQYEGQFTLAIKLVDPSNSVTGTMRIVDGIVSNTHVDGAVDPTGTAVPGYEEVLATYEQAVAAINKTVRFDAVQSLTDTQKATARSNISAPSVAEMNTAVGNEATARQDADALKVNISDIENDLTGTTAGKVLDARQGKVLDDKVSDVKSAVVESNKELYKIPLELVPTSSDTFSLVSGGLNATTGANTTQTSRSRCSLFDIKPGYSYMVELTDPTYYIVNGFGYSSTSISSSMTGKMKKIDDWHMIYHAEDTAICARCSFGITADNTQAMTDSDRAAILAAFNVYMLTDESLSVGGAPADAKKTGEVRTDLETLRESVADEENIDWAEHGNVSYPTGWALGYYDGSDGSDVASNVYIRSVKSQYITVKDATMMEVTAPDGYAVRAYEYKPDGTYVGAHGSIVDKEVGGHYFFEFEKGSKFHFAMGKFDGVTDSTNHYTDSNFLATCIVKFYVLHSSILEEQVFNISENLSYIFYEGSITYEADQWRTGYYGSQDGAYKSSNKYLCTKNDVLISNPNVLRITAKAPEGYNIAVYEYASGVYVRKYGSIVSTNEVEVAANPESSYRLALGQFTGGTAPDHLTNAFIGQIQVSINELKLPESNTKLSRTGDFEWFTVTVDRPLSFGGEEVIDQSEEQEIECVLRLPTSYTRNGKPTRLVLACHGASGYIQASSSKWYNSYWKAFMDSLLAAGYAVFDSNVLPTSTGADQMGYAVGSPLYVNVLKKAYDYIVYNYNVYEKIFAHGTSMGGVGASAFAHAYPQIVLAESSFAGRDMLQYVNMVKQGTSSEIEYFAISYGYDSYSALMADKFSHAVGNSPSLSLRKVNSDGTITLPPDRETAYSDWLNFWSAVYSYGRNDDAGLWIGDRTVPYKAWNAWADRENATKLEEILKQAYTAGSACPYYTVAYDISDAEVAEYRTEFDDQNLTRHSFMSYGMIYDMRDQLIAWYKRWE